MYAVDMIVTLNTRRQFARTERRKAARVATNKARLQADLAAVTGTDIGAANARQSLRLQLFDLRADERIVSLDSLDYSGAE
jgi:hypothetical protein